MSVREASHAGSWYSRNGRQLSQQIDTWLSAVADDALPDSNRLPLANARVVISPHAGYAYSGPPAAWAYRCLDLSKAKRIFILHPSHHQHLRTAALPTVTAYETPLDPEPLPLDLETIEQILSLKITDHQGRAVQLTTMSQSVDEAEHSCEMQLPYIHRLLQKLYPGQSPSSYPPLVPMMVGGTNPSIEKAIGKMLAPYIADDTNVFVLSSDFCHWGSRFGYTYYLPDAPSPAMSPLMLPNGIRGEFTTAQTSTNEDVHKMPTLGAGEDLRSSAKVKDPKIYESIAHADRACMCAIASGKHDEFLRVLNETGNTVCGRHPIGVFMAGVEELERQDAMGGGGDGDDDDALKRKFRFMRYERSSDAETVKDSSVSYVSAFAVL